MQIFPIVLKGKCTYSHATFCNVGIFSSFYAVLCTHSIGSLNEPDFLSVIPSIELLSDSYPTFTFIMQSKTLFNYIFSWFSYQTDLGFWKSCSSQVWRPVNNWLIFWNKILFIKTYSVNELQENNFSWILTKNSRILLKT